MNKHRYNLLIAIFAIIFSSCTSWLDVDLVDQVTEEDLFSKESGYYEALAGIYSKMASTNMYGGNLSMETLEILAQSYDYTSLESNYPKLRDYDYEDSKVKGRIANIWNTGYDIISGANNIIRYARKSEILSRRDKNQVLGEALAIRAFMHFDLIRLFCPDVKLSPKEDGIPYNKQFGVALPIVYTVEECIELVKNDLLEAEKLLSESDKILDIVPYELGYDQETKEIINKDNADKYVARMNYYAVQGLLARVYLAKGDNKKAREYAEKVINSGKFRLLEMKKSIDVAAEQLDIQFSDEHIFSLRNIEIPEYSEAKHKKQESGGSTKPAKLKPSSPYDLYDTGIDDVRFNIWFESGYIEKYIKENTDFYTPKIVMLKLSEIYLIAAEGWWEIDRNKSIKYLNDLRRSRIKEYSKWFYVNKNDLINEIRREFISEGQLFFNYKRLNHDIIRMTGEGDVKASNKIFVFPMPESEIENGHRK